MEQLLSVVYYSTCPVITLLFDRSIRKAVGQASVTL